MSTATPAPVQPAVPAAPRRRIWPWIVALFVAPFLILAAVVLSYVTLDRDAATLRRHVMAATGSDWHTKVQLSVGNMTLGAVQTAMYFVRDKDAAIARTALGAVQSASVGVYELASGNGVTPATRKEFFVRTDEAMKKRGWTRMVGVADNADTVLVYVADEPGDGDEMKLCVAVVSGRELVVVSTLVDAAALAELAEHTPGGLRDKLHLARL